jgi:hypothetical protein
MKKSITPALVKSILKSGTFNDFIGYAENEYFEAKQPLEYFVQGETSDKGQLKKDELAKDIAGFANSKKNGCIVCGLVTEEKGDAPVDTISSVSLGKFTDEQIGRIKECIKEKIFPRLNATISRYESKDKNGELLVIEIPATSAGGYQFVTHSNEVGGKERECFYVPIRSIASINYLSTKDLHSLYREPNSTEAMLIAMQERLLNIEAKLPTGDGVKDIVSINDEDDKTFLERLKDALDEK